MASYFCIPPEAGETDFAQIVSTLLVKSGIRPAMVSNTLVDVVAAASSGDTIYVGPGTFTVTASLSVPSGVNLIGFSKETSKITGAIDDVVVLNGSQTMRGLHVFSTPAVGGDKNERAVSVAVDADDVEIIDCRLEGDTDVVRIGTGGVGTSVGRVLIQNCHFPNCRFDGILNMGGANETTIMGCVFDGTVGSEGGSFAPFVLNGDVTLVGNVINVTDTEESTSGSTISYCKMTGANAAVLSTGNIHRVAMSSDGDDARFVVVGPGVSNSNNVFRSEGDIYYVTGTVGDNYMIQNNGNANTFQILRPTTAISVDPTGLANAVVQLDELTSTSGTAGLNIETITGTKTLVISDAVFQKLNPSGGAQDVILPAEAISAGKAFKILQGGAIDNLVVKNDADATIFTLGSGATRWFACDGTSWIHLGS